VVLPYLQCLPSAIFQKYNARTHVARNVQELFFTHKIESLPWPACSPRLSPIENVWSMLAQRMTRDTPPLLIRWTMVVCGSHMGCYTQGYIQSFFASMPRRMAAVIATNGGYTNYWFCHHSHFTRCCDFNRFIFVLHVICQIHFAVIFLVLLGVGVWFRVASSVHGCTYTTKEIIEIRRREGFVV